MSTLKSFLSILFISQTIHARSFNPCELENELLNVYNLTIGESRNLTCVAQKYSELTTNIINNGTNTVYYGIFQIGQKWCDVDKPGGKCNIKCDDLVDDDITDDIKCAQKLFQRLGKKAWKLNKNSGCKKEFNYLDENCHKNANIDDKSQVQQDFCELARKLMTLYDISKIDATIWSCISEYSKTGNSNLRSEEENRRDDEDSCVKTRDVECAIKNNKETGISGFTNWPVYEQYCKNITDTTCFELTGTKSVNRSDTIEQIKNVENTEISTTSKKPKIFTTSTEISVIIEEDDGRIIEHNNTDITTESIGESLQTTEFLSDTLEKPSYDETIEGYSKVRLMSADKSIVESPETLETATKSLDERTLINSSLVVSTTESISTELSYIEQTTEAIELRYYEIINRCVLAKDMAFSGRIPQNLISTFLCIAEHESGLNVSYVETDGQQSRYGLFQIDNQIYCSTNDKINQCNVLCAHLSDDQFDNDFECVRHIYKKEGLNYWPSYEKSCKNINSHSLDYCYEQFTTSQRPFTVLNKDEFYSTEGTSVATRNDLTHMETTTVINETDLEPSDGLVDFCEFSNQLKVNLTIGIWEDLVHYVCIADQISHLNPKQSKHEDDRLGIFGLKEYTCGRYEAGGFCSILCSSLLDDDLIDDAECMIKVYKELGLKEWNIDKDSCKIYTPKILQCIDEGKFSVPSDDENDDKLDLSRYEPDNIQVGVEEVSEMAIPRTNFGTESLESAEDLNKSDHTTVPLIESTSYIEDATIKSATDIPLKKYTKNEQKISTETTSLPEISEAAEKYEDEEPVVALKNPLESETYEEIELESTTPEFQKNEGNQITTTIKYEDYESNENSEESIEEFDLLTTTESLLRTGFAEKINLKSEEDDVPKTTTKSYDEISTEPLEIVDNTEVYDHIEKTTTLNKINEDEEENNILDETTEIEKNQTAHDHYKIENETIQPEILQKKIFSENAKKFIQEETTSGIGLEIEKSSESSEPELLNSDNFLEYTEKSPEEETTSENVLNIEPIHTESVANKSESLSENTEKLIQQQTTPESIRNTDFEDQIYLKSTTESSATDNMLHVTENLHQLMKKIGEIAEEQTTESDLQDKTELAENTVVITESNEKFDGMGITEDSSLKFTTENLYYTSIREIIEEYKKSNVENIDNLHSKRNQNYSEAEDQTTQDNFLEREEEEESTHAFKSLNQHISTKEFLLTSTATVEILQKQKFEVPRIDKCTLAEYMNNTGFPENLIPTLICIAEHESQLNPSTVKIYGSLEKYGLFQIDDNIYCSTNEKINECDVPCAHLTDNQYDNDFECVRHIYKKEGFDYWPSYEKSCKNVNTNVLDYCNEEFTTSHRPFTAFDENLELHNFQSTTTEISQIEDTPVVTESPNLSLINNESKSIIRKFDLCELTRELYSRNISIDDIPQYLCIADIKSHLKIRIPNENEQSYGLFFINSEFCGQNESGGICSMKCSELWDSNISDDVDCVQKIVETNGTDKWNLNSEACQIYDNKVLECFDKNEFQTTEFPKISKIDVDGVQRNASISRHDVITESENLTDMISDMTDKNLEDLKQVRSSNADIESEEMTTEETTTQDEEVTSRIIQILTSTASADITDSIIDDKSTQNRKIPLVEINLPREILNDRNLSKQVDTLIKKFTYYDVLPRNGSIIFNIFNFNIYGENHDIKYTINPVTQPKDEN